ncbi:Delta(12)-fatty-acid desaturase [Cymbomonas tetramitiformis]|uniref:Delta(12)-fatty-acid desaturase n=1 Tax=Cymbomonas tetramitiformis TaxID=36881 RepID=A0AAE0GN27_9CHLO|nr:Delta(12)-fatty-acid desaturase [Cymbomonas tetramitiformis]
MQTVRSVRSVSLRRSAEKSSVSGKARQTTLKPHVNAVRQVHSLRCLRPVSRGRTHISAVAVPAEPPSEAPVQGLPDDIILSGLQGKALKINEWPSKSELLGCIPKHCFKKDTVRSMYHAAVCTAMTVACGLIGYYLIPMKLAFAPVWAAYAAVTGTVATGCWVIAHECGHMAFSDNKILQDTVGYILHTALLVPYFSWQRSHAVHHSKTNHLSEGETHVPYVQGQKKGDGTMARREKFGDTIYGTVRLLTHLIFGWPAYLIAGATGGPVRGVTNHFLPFMGAEGKHKLFPGQWTAKVYWSDLGIVGFLGLLGYWAAQVGAAKVALVYGAPLCFTNIWLVLYTWLQHSDTDIPHYDGDDWNFVKGALCTVDRPYGAVLDFLHHRIGSTHVAHHVNSAIPHYHALEATNAIKAAYPDHYLYDPTPIGEAMWRVAVKCGAVAPYGDDGKWVFRQASPA